MKYAAFMLLTVTPEWLSLSSDERKKFNEEVVGPILERHAGKVNARWFDTEAFTGCCSDIALFESEDPLAYYEMFEELRDTDLFAKPYLYAEGVIFGIEEGFHQAAATNSGSGSGESR